MDGLAQSAPIVPTLKMLAGPGCLVDRIGPDFGITLRSQAARDRRCSEHDGTLEATIARAVRDARVGRCVDLIDDETLADALADEEVCGQQACLE